MRLFASRSAPLRRLAASAPARYVAQRYRRQTDFVLDRLRPGGAFGLVLTIQLTILVAAGVAFSELADDVLENELVGVDGPIAQFVEQQREPWLTTAMFAITWLGSATVLVPVALAVGILAAYRIRSRRPIALLALVLVGSTVLVQLIKLLVARPRPDSGLITELGYSFPSGHTTAATAGWGALALVLCGLVTHRRTQVAICVGAVLVALLVGITRVYLGVHEPTDVLGGWALGVGWVAAVTASLHVYSARRRRTGSEGSPSA